jgi:hypothetical protein
LKLLLPAVLAVFRENQDRKDLKDLKDLKAKLALVLFPRAQ